jgi:hypothetical protein
MDTQSYPPNKIKENQQKSTKEARKIKNHSHSPLFSHKKLKWSKNPQEEKIKPQEEIKYLSTTLTTFFPQLRKSNPPPTQNDLFPP